jgi:hypothetical protein
MKSLDLEFWGLMLIFILDVSQEISAKEIRR